MQLNTIKKVLLRLPQVLERFYVSRSKLCAGVNEGEYPQLIRLGSRCTMWREEDIDQLIEEVSG
mgnify:CR=1 FL=1